MNSTQTIKIQKTTTSRISEVHPENIPFGNIFSDHMFVVDFQDGEWQNPIIMPYGPLALSPATSALHYGQAIFEGLKAYKTPEGQIELFRPIENFKRLNKSAVRLSMPEIPEELFFEGLTQLLKIDQQWILPQNGCSLYIRPYMFANDHYLGVRTALNYKFLIITSPAGGYFSEPLKVIVEQKYVRAAEGGMGFAKAAGNYGVSIYPTKLAQEKGYHQIIWTDSHEHKYIEELGMMNFMCIINDTLITPGLESNTILHGVTRDSVLTIAKDWGMKVEERKIAIGEVIAAIDNGTLKEVFGVGTAATVAHIATIGYQGKDYELPDVADNDFSKRVASHLVDIRSGKVADSHNWIFKI
jgi:branched-chain amino acid aminotransferase